jgi:tetratricopeptide (TPR) repeat protein
VTGKLKQAEQHLRRGEIDPAAALAEGHLREHESNAQALYILAVCRRYQRINEDALELLHELRELAPAHARAAQEMGHNLRQLKDHGKALIAYQHAVALNPALLASWRAIKELTSSGSVENRHTLHEHARNRVDALSSLPPQLLVVTSQLNEGKLYQAEQLCRDYLQQHAHHPEAMRLLALLGMRLNVYDDAEFLLASCLELYPDFSPARLDYIQVLHRRQKYAAALDQAVKLRATAPEKLANETAFANESMAVGRYEDAMDSYRRIIARVPDSPGIHLAYGHALKTIGRRSEAEDAYRRAYQLKADFGDAYWSLANLKTYRFSDAELDRMEQQEATPSTQLHDRFHLCFALGKAYEQRKDYATSFHWYEFGNKLKLDQSRYRAESTSRDFQAQRKICDHELFSRKRHVGHDARDPIFIVGLPRAGSTLLEQILSSHSQVNGTFELPNILALAHRLGGRRRVDKPSRYPGVLANLDADMLRKYGEQYIEDSQVYRKGAPFFTDKMPNNFRHLGLVHMILPNAKIIDARRHPLACCFSCFKQLFAEGQEFTYGLETVGHYYKDYVELMDHWDRVLPEKILRVLYEDMVDDIEGQVRRMLDYCGLPWEDACLNFHENQRSVRTASSEQVRQPLYRNELEQWRHYSQFLGPLRQALGPVLESYPE